jgi:hypothetical protein
MNGDRKCKDAVKARGDSIRGGAPSSVVPLVTEQPDEIEVIVVVRIRGEVAVTRLAALFTDAISLGGAPDGG